MRKLSITILCCLILLFCGIYSRKNDVEKKVTIQFASWGSESEIRILKPILADFEKENPNVKIDFLHIPQNYFQKIHLLFASNLAPDVIFINNQFLPVYANAGVLENLDKYNIFNFQQFFDKSIKALSYNGKIYAIPRDISTLVIFYNKDIFDKYRINYPHNNWTYEEFLTTAQKLTHLPEIFGVSFEEEPLFYMPYLMSFGEKAIPNFDNTKTQIGLKNYADLRNKYHVAPFTTEAASASMAQLFLQGRLAMHVSGRWLVPKYRQDADFHWDIVSFPAGTSGNITPLDASGWAIAKSSKHKNEAAKLIKYLSSKQSIEHLTKSGLIVPARIDVAKSNAFLDNKSPQNARVFLDTINNSIPTPVSVDYREKMDILKQKTEELFNK